MDITTSQPWSISQAQGQAQTQYLTAEPVFEFEDTNMPTSRTHSFHSQPSPIQPLIRRTFAAPMMPEYGTLDQAYNSLPAISEHSSMNMYTVPFHFQEQPQRQQQFDISQSQFSFPPSGALNTAPAKNVSLLSAHFKAQQDYIPAYPINAATNPQIPQAGFGTSMGLHSLSLQHSYLDNARLAGQDPVISSSGHFKPQQDYAPTYPIKVATSPPMSQTGFGASAGLHTLSPQHSYLGNARSAEQDPTISMNFEEDHDLIPLSPDLTSPGSEFSMTDPSQAIVPSNPIKIPGNKPHGRVPSTSSSLRGHPYSRTSSFIANSDMMSPISPPSMSPVEHMKQFTPQQQVAAANILNYKAHHPEASIPASFITTELAEVHDGRGWCLIANCGVERAKQKNNPLYHISKGTSRKRLDHLYDHIRDKHFNCRPFVCGMSPAWYVPLLMLLRHVFY